MRPHFQERLSPTMWYAHYSDKLSVREKVADMVADLVSDKIDLMEVGHIQTITEIPLPIFLSSVPPIFPILTLCNSQILEVPFG